MRWGSMMSGTNKTPRTLFSTQVSNPYNNSKKVLLIAVTAADYLFVNALSQDPESHPLHFALRVRDYDNEDEDGGTSYVSQYRNFGRLVRCAKREILSKLNRIPQETIEIQSPRDEMLFDALFREHFLSTDCSGYLFSTCRAVARGGGDNQLHGPNKPYCRTCSPGSGNPRWAGR